MKGDVFQGAYVVGDDEWLDWRDDSRVFDQKSQKEDVDRQQVGDLQKEAKTEKPFGFIGVLLNYLVREVGMEWIYLQRENDDEEDSWEVYY